MLRGGAERAVAGDHVEQVGEARQDAGGIVVDGHAVELAAGGPLGAAAEGHALAVARGGASCGQVVTGIEAGQPTAGEVDQLGAGHKEEGHGPEAIEMERKARRPARRAKELAGGAEAGVGEQLGTALAAAGALVIGVAVAGTGRLRGGAGGAAHAAHDGGVPGAQGIDQGGGQEGCALVRRALAPKRSQHADRNREMWQFTHEWFY